MILKRLSFCKWHLKFNWIGFKLALWSSTILQIEKLQCFIFSNILQFSQYKANRLLSALRMVTLRLAGNSGPLPPNVIIELIQLPPSFSPYPYHLVIIWLYIICVAVRIATTAGPLPKLFKTFPLRQHLLIMWLCWSQIFFGPPPKKKKEKKRKKTK